MAVKKDKVIRGESPTALRAGWQIVRFGQMAENVTDRIDNPSEAGVERYVGLEHLDPESLKIRRWGSPEDVEATKLRFKPGDIIFGKRRAYQRKLAVADFEGICSAHAMVLRAREETVVKEFLPFFMQSDIFFDRALSISVGSLSPTINWKTLASQQFAIPPKNEQYRTGDILWSCDEVMQKFREIAVKAQDCKKVLFEELLFGRKLVADDEKTGRDWLNEIHAARRRLLGSASTEPLAVNESSLHPLSAGWCWARVEQICYLITKGTTPAKNKLYANKGEVPYIKVYNLTNTGALNFSIDPTFIDLDTHINELVRSRVFPQDVLMNIVGPPLGKVSIVPSTYPEWNLNQAIAVFRPLGGYSPDFLCQYLLRDETQDWLYRRSKKTSGQRNLTLEVCRNLPIPIPPPSIQNRIDLIIQRMDRSIKDIHGKINILMELKKSLMRLLLRPHNRNLNVG